MKCGTDFNDCPVLTYGHKERGRPVEMFQLHYDHPALAQDQFVSMSPSHLVYKAEWECSGFCSTLPSGEYTKANEINEGDIMVVRSGAQYVTRPVTDVTKETTNMYYYFPLGDGFWVNDVLTSPFVAGNTGWNHEQQLARTAPMWQTGEPNLNGKSFQDLSDDASVPVNGAMYDAVRKIKTSTHRAADFFAEVGRLIDLGEVFDLPKFQELAIDFEL